MALPPFREPGSARRHARAAIVGERPASCTRRPRPTRRWRRSRAPWAGGWATSSSGSRLDRRPSGARRRRRSRGRRSRAQGSTGARSSEACEVPFQVTVPPVAALDPRTLADLHELALGEDAGALHVTVPGAAPAGRDDRGRGDRGVAARPAARGRARARIRRGRLGRLFGERWVSGVEVSTRRHGVDEPQVTEHGPLAAATDLDHERNAHLRFRERADDLDRARGDARPADPRRAPAGARRAPRGRAGRSPPCRGPLDRPALEAPPGELAERRDVVAEDVLELGAQGVVAARASRTASRTAAGA